MGKKKSGSNIAIHLRKISSILASQDPDISPDLDLRLGLIPVTASPPHIHPVHLALIMDTSNLDIVSGMVLSILNLTLVLTEVTLRKISEERDSRQQQRTLSLRYVLILK